MGLAKKYRVLFILIALPLQVILVQYLSNHQAFIERHYTQGFYQYLSKGLRIITGLTTFPVGQLVFYGLIVLILIWLFKKVKLLWFKQISIKRFASGFVLDILLFLAGFYFLFTFMWGLNYHREPVQQIVQINDQPFTLPELKNLCRKLILLTNQSRIKITSDTTKALNLPFSKKELLGQAGKGYLKAAQLYPEFTYTRPAVKAVLVPEIMSSFGIGGIYFPFTGEANVNMDPPDFLLPETICHEMAHQIGFASEDEANYVAYLVCRLHPEPAFQYSGNLTALKYTMNRLNMLDSLSFKSLRNEISPGVIHDLKKNRAYWESFQNPIEVVGEFIHDLFLKANDQEEGIQSYSRVVELLMGEYRKNGLEYDNLKSGGQKQK